MHYRFLITLLAVWLVASGTASAQEVSIIPQPARMVVQKEAAFRLTKATVIYADPLHQASALYLQQYLKSYYNINVVVQPAVKGKDYAGIVLLAADGAEGSYILSSNKRSVKIAGENAGAFYGVQSLLQLLRKEKGAITVPAVVIEDKPRFAWRGLHLDVGRHFMPASFVKKYIDLMAHYKLNTFHWHLTDNEGWRIQIDRYPKLTEVGSRMNKWSAEGKIRRYANIVGGGNEGFYTKEQIREIVAYAKARHITIVPEVDVPGHSEAALYAYPEFAAKDSTGKPAIGNWKYVCMFEPSEKAFTFIENVLTEVIELFPSQYVHIGGDEADMGVWLKSPETRAMMKREGLADEREVQSYFIRRLEKFLLSKGKRLIGWDEILEGGLAPSATVMSWRGESGGIQAARMKHDVVMTPVDPLYFDYYQGEARNEPLAFGGLNTLKKVYHYDPLANELTPEEAKYILGAQANIWTESMADERQVEYMAYPRALALAEVCWTAPERKNWDNFTKRLGHHFSLLHQWNVNYRLHEPSGLNNAVISKPSWTIALLHPDPAARMYYTLDGSKPDSTDAQYNGPLDIRADADSVPVNVLTVSTNSRQRRYSSAMIRRIALAPAAQVPADVNTVRYSFYKASVSTCRKIQSLTPHEQGELQGVDVPGKYQSLSVPFAMRFDGYVNIEEAGDYKLSITSDDGSVLYLGGAKVIDNDGYHGAIERDVFLSLGKGSYPYTLYYFDGGGGKVMRMQLTRK